MKEQKFAKGVTTSEEPGMDLLSRLGANCFRKTFESGKSAKDEIRKVLGSPLDNGQLPDYTITELSKMTKKSEVNVRTMLSDLRSTKYCGKRGVFLTERIKRPDGQIAFRMIAPGAYAEAALLVKDVPGLTPSGLHDGRGGGPVDTTNILPAQFETLYWRKFKKAYLEALTAAVKKKPTDYDYPLSEVPSVVVKMMFAIKAGTANKQGCLNVVCKKLKLPYSTKAMREYLSQ